MKCQKEPDLSVGLCRHSLATNGLPLAAGPFPDAAVAKSTDVHREVKIFYAPPPLKMRCAELVEASYRKIQAALTQKLPLVRVGG